MFSIPFLNELRRSEWDAIVDLFPPGCRILEIGAGTGAQAVLMISAGFDVTAIDLDVSNYAEHRVFPVIDYDGKTFPFADSTFDVVFSSNVLEHVLDLENLHRESKRVLKDNGVCVHVIPTHIWRFWTSIASVPAFVRALWDFIRSPGRKTFRQVGSRGYVMLCQPRHGERGTVLTELWTFSPKWWHSHFQQSAFEIVDEREVGLFYTGESVLGPHLSISKRRHWALQLGSACYVFKLHPKS